MENRNITLEEYRELIKKAERISAAERLINSGGYVTVDDIAAILDIKRVKENENA